MVATAKPQRLIVAAGAVLALLFVLFGPALGPINLGRAQTPAPGEETVSLSIGASTMITLGENRSTGYSWRLETAQSTNLEIVRVIDRGYRAEESGLLGAAGSHRWQITAQAAGTARVVFTYSRSWQKGDITATKAVNVTVTGSQ
jgi:inhibitor of cysteine peptidase